MLSFIFYVIFLIPLCFFNFWYIYIYSLFILMFFFFSLFRLFDYFSFLGCGFGLDKFSFGFCILSMWICIMMVYSMIFYLNSVYSWLYLLNLNFIILFLFMCFSSLDFFSFYFYFESSVLPVFLIILGWGYQPERLRSGWYLIFYTLFSSLPLLLMIFYFSNLYGYLYFYNFFSVIDLLKSFFFLFAFLVKFPMFMFHFWLPKAHVEAPVSGSMILAGVMLKLGGYGLIRMSLYLEKFFFSFGYVFISLSLIGSLYISMFCLVQSDLKVIIAYSSVSHMGMVISGLFTLNDFGLVGGYFLMIGHGLISSGLFYWVGCIYDRFGSRSIFILKGLMNFMPSFSLMLFFLCICNMSCPPSMNLFSEICIVFSLFTWSLMSLPYLFMILFFTACYSIMIFSSTQHGSYNSLIYYVDGGLIREYMLFLFHLMPFFLMIFGLEYFY
uniref:NADH-ubiquinone oxidoreductase chain 4 n=1 Tax=Oliarus cf. filicicola HI01081 TaxID=2879485 RepID=A0A8K1I0A9_9HEMI|nr:NADH dehydrogenase subunit 4 [Oliarus cf. filicicola HI01081]